MVPLPSAVSFRDFPHGTCSAQGWHGRCVGKCTRPVIVTHAAGTQDLPDVVDTMPQTRSPFAPASRRLRPAGPHCHGGASSLLRLSNAAAPRLPTAPALADWVQRAAGVLGLKQDGPAFAASEFLR